MSNFHALAVFEACGASTEDIQAEVSSLMSSFSHQRVHYHAHEISESPSTSASNAGQVYCMVFVDCDVDAHSEEKAMELASDLFDDISTQTSMYLALGLLPGRPRVSRRREEADSRAEPRSDTGSAERRGRQANSRGQSRARRQARSRRKAVEGSTEERAVEKQVASDENRVSPPPSDQVRVEAETDTPDLQAAEPTGVHDQLAAPDASNVLTASDAPTELEVALNDTVPVGPPPRSSNAMQVTITVKLRASEFIEPSNGELPLDQPDRTELVRMATAEARTRHPEVPENVRPESEMIPLPGGDTLLSLTWKYPAPIPSSRDNL